MRFLFPSFVILIAALIPACSGESKPDTPIESFKVYVNAVKQKNTTTMKNRLSAESIKMHEQEAKAQGVTLDDVVKRETLFTEGQKTVEFRNQKIEGEKATIEVKNSFGSWETVPFVREDDEWKIDKKGYAERLIQETELPNQQMEDLINQGKQPPL
ncbi:MAG TPA: hypothetical protein VMZ26_16215 [Pyrinomonadaceae bacterium]|nr:hypothetical protein [Pyrinomonadaceae bacterium]